MEIQVTQEDIDAGSPRSAASCPIALAMKRATGKPWRVLNVIAICEPATSEQSKRVSLPEEASNFIAAFDMFQRVSPFTFELTDL